MKIIPEVAVNPELPNTTTHATHAHAHANATHKFYHAAYLG